MAVLITIFTIFTGTASVLGFLVVFFKDGASGIYRWVCAIGFGIAVLWSAYVLFVPGTSIEENVAGKVAYYRAASVDQKSDRLVIERGEVSFSGFGPFSIEFPQPFRDPPDVEVVNFRGYDADHVPIVERKTAQQVIFKRSTVGGSWPESMQVFRWIARGVPLEQAPPSK